MTSRVGRTLFLVAVLAACRGDRFKETIRELPEGGSATDAATGMSFKFNQKNAGTPDPSGWYAAKSIPCGFQVNLPGPYNDFSQTATTTDGATLQIHVVGTRTVEGAKFTVTCTERSDNKMPPDWKEDVVSGLRADNPDLKQQYVTIGGVDGLRFSVSTSATAAIGFLAAADNRAYQLMVEYPHSEAEYMPELADTFFASFRARE